MNSLLDIVIGCLHILLIILINLNRCHFFYPHNGLYTEIHLPNLQLFLISLAYTELWQMMQRDGGARFPPPSAELVPLEQLNGGSPGWRSGDPPS